LHVLVVEDEPKLLENLIIGLTHMGFEVTGVSDGRGVDAALLEKKVDIIVLDLGLPGEDGLEIAKRIRIRSAIGLIIVTSRGLTEDRILGYEGGADLYFVKPVDMGELAAAIRSVERRLAKTSHSVWRLEIESSSLVTPGNIKVRLNSQEISVVKVLLSKIGEDVGRWELLDVLGLPDDVSFYPRLEVLISRMRSKVLKADPAFPLPIHSRYSRGYAFILEIYP
jgi:DNA-binding response OmpR family regulator